MEVLPSRFQSLKANCRKCYSDSLEDGTLYYYDYVDKNGEIGGHSVFKEMDREESGDFGVVWYSLNTSSGYQLVQFSDGMFGFNKASGSEEWPPCGTIMPYKFDIASEFNEYGYAMVGKNGWVNWINRDFEYITLDMKKRKLLSFSEEDLFRGGEWQGISAFSEGECPLSAMYTYQESRRGGTLKYLNPKGEKQTFKRFDGQIWNDEISVFNPTDFASDGARTFSMDDIQFGSDGIKILDSRVLFSRGYYSSLKDVLRIASESGIDIVAPTIEAVKRISFEPKDNK